MGLFDDIPRGVVERDGEAQFLEDQTMPAARFMPLDAIRQSRCLAP